MREPWYPAFRSELLSFPAGKHDDQVDALGLIGQVLDRMQPGTAPPKPPEPIRGASEMTMDEAWTLAKPNRRGCCTSAQNSGGGYDALEIGPLEVWFLLPRN